MHSLTFSRYQWILIVLYAALLPVFFVYRASFSFGDAPAGVAFDVFIISIVVFGVFMYRRFGAPSLKNRSLALPVLYAALVALSEEIIFRGYIQASLQLFLPVSVSILLASLVFGAAHLPNAAKGRTIRNWNWQFAGVTFLAGLPLGLLFYLTQGLFSSVLLHVIFVLGIYLWKPSR